MSIFPGATEAPMDANVMLRGAIRADLETVVIIGVSKDGSDFISCSGSSTWQALWMLEQAKLDLLNLGRDDT